MAYRTTKNDKEEAEVIEDVEKEEVEVDYEQLYVELHKKYRKSASTIASYQEENKDLQKEIDELNSEIDMLKTEKMELLNRCDELEKQLETMESLPVEPMEVAKLLINSKYEYETSELQRRLLNKGDTETCERYNIDELEQIAEHLLIYCKHNKGCEE